MIKAGLLGTRVGFPGSGQPLRFTVLYAALTDHRPNRFDKAEKMRYFIHLRFNN